MLFLGELFHINGAVTPFIPKNDMLSDLKATTSGGTPPVADKLRQSSPPGGKFIDVASRIWRGISSDISSSNPTLPPFFTQPTDNIATSNVASAHSVFKSPQDEELEKVKLDKIILIFQMLRLEAAFDCGGAAEAA